MCPLFSFQLAHAYSLAARPQYRRETRAARLRRGCRPVHGLRLGAYAHGRLAGSRTGISSIQAQDRGIADMVAMYNTSLDAEVDHFMGLFASFLPAAFSLDASQTVHGRRPPTPVMKAGDQTLNLDFSIPRCVFRPHRRDLDRVRANRRRLRARDHLAQATGRPARGRYAARSQGARLWPSARRQALSWHCETVRQAVHHEVPARRRRERPRDRRVVRRRRHQ